MVATFPERKEETQVQRTEYVYIIQSGYESSYKIGHSKHPRKRLRQLQTGHPQKLFLVHSISCREHPARKIEKFLHSRLSFHRSRPGSEWFQLSNEIIDWLVSIQADTDLYLSTPQLSV